MTIYFKNASYLNKCSYKSPKGFDYNKSHKISHIYTIHIKYFKTYKTFISLEDHYLAKH